MTAPSKADPPRWAYLPFRIAITVAALLLFDQAVFAGQFLTGAFGALQTHRDNATYSGIAVVVAAGCAVLVRRPGRGPIWPVFACLGLFALVALQITLGFARALAVHIPLGVAIVVLAALLVIRAWRPWPAVRVATPRLAEQAAGSDVSDETSVRV
jgi:hypothetical protein